MIKSYINYIKAIFSRKSSEFQFIYFETVKVSSDYRFKSHKYIHFSKRSRDSRIYVINENRFNSCNHSLETLLARLHQ